MRKAFTFAEMLAVLFLLPVAMLVAAGLFHTLGKEVPKHSRMIQEHTTVLDLVSRIREDVTGAASLPDAFMQYESGEKTLLVELPSGTVCYELTDGNVTRKLLTASADKHPETSWSLPNSSLHWELRRNNSQAYAVELTTSISHRIRKEHFRKMSNAHLFFKGMK